jgi:DNA-binding transcriptional LysR family regulator
MACFSVQTGSVTLTAAGQHFARDVATLSMTARRLTERIKRSEAIRERVSRLGMGKDV